MAEKPTYAELEQRVKYLEKQLADKTSPKTDKKTQATGGSEGNAGVEAKKRILVIDDSKVDQMIMEEILIQAGYDVVLASDGKEGLERFYENPPDLVITDMVMPEKMGIDLILEIREKYPEQKIIAVSAGGVFGPEIELSMAEEFKAYTITTPFDPEKILTIVAELLLPHPTGQEKPEPKALDDQILPDKP